MTVSVILHDYHRPLGRVVVEYYGGICAQLLCIYYFLCELATTTTFDEQELLDSMFVLLKKGFTVDRAQLLLNRNIDTPNEGFSVWDVAEVGLGVENGSVELGDCAARQVDHQIALHIGCQQKD